MLIALKGDTYVCTLYCIGFLWFCSFGTDFSSQKRALKSLIFISRISREIRILFPGNREIKNPGFPGKRESGNPGLQSLLIIPCIEAFHRRLATELVQSHGCLLTHCTLSKLVHFPVLSILWCI